MTYVHLYKKKVIIKGEISILGSKSLSNRLLILQKIYKNIEIQNLSSSEDTLILKKSLESIEGISKETKSLNIGPCGTAMRFLSAYMASQEGLDVILSGSKQMHKRPIGPLIEALKKLGSSIFYLQNEGYPPIKIQGQKLKGGEINLDATISSQFISALMMIGPSLEKGLQIVLKGKITSRPYLKMTYSLLKEIGAQLSWEENLISIKPGVLKLKKIFFVESDWSSASYYYLMASLSKECDLYLKSYNKNSLQGDSKLVQIYSIYFGINTTFEENMKIRLTKISGFIFPEFLTLDLNDTPDLAQSIIVNCAALKIKCKLKGLKTLNIKETNRLEALRIELKKIGIKSLITLDSFEIIEFEKKEDQIFINTYEDHRMAMSFAPLALLYPININQPKVVKKSYPNFWKDLNLLGFETNKEL